MREINMGFVTKTLIAIISFCSFVAGVWFALDALRIHMNARSAIHEIYAAVTTLCAICSFGVYAIINMLDGIAAEIQTNRNYIRGPSSPLD